MRFIQYGYTLTIVFSHTNQIVVFVSVDRKDTKVWLFPHNPIQGFGVADERAVRRSFDAVDDQRLEATILLQSSQVPHSKEIRLLVKHGRAIDLASTFPWLVRL